jgi:hypothetical protein
MKLCVFCGEPGGNVEHIIAQWLIDRMQAQDYPIVVAHRKEDTFKTRPAHGLKAYTTKAVCEACNTGWMRELELWFQTNMGSVVEPDWPKLGCDTMRLALRENESLAKWALKTAIMMDVNSIAKKIIDEKTPHELYAGRIAEGIIVEVAHIHDRSVGGILSQGFWVRNGGRPPEWQEHSKKMAFKVVIQLNHLAIRVFRAPEAKETYYGPNQRFPLRCYPETQDPHKIDFRFHDLFEFDRVLELETWLGA